MGDNPRMFYHPICINHVYNHQTSCIHVCIYIYIRLNSSNSIVMTIINKNDLSSSTKTSISTMFAKHCQALWDHSMQPDLLLTSCPPTSDGAECLEISAGPMIRRGVSYRSHRNGWPQKYGCQLYFLRKPHLWNVSSLYNCIERTYYKHLYLVNGVNGHNCS